MHPPFKGTVSEKYFIESLMPDYLNRKSEHVIKKSKEYYPSLDQNLWQNEYQLSDKFKKLSQVKYNDASVDEA